MAQRKLIYQGKVVRVEQALTVLPNGHEFEMEVVQHPGGAAMVALNDAKEICLLKHYRCVLDQWLWELPAGKIDNREDPLDTAQRELVEEVGLTAQQWQDLGVCISSPGVFTERVHLFLATGLKSVPSAAEDDEVFELHWLPLRTAWEMLLQGEIEDAKTIVGIFRAVAKIHPNLVSTMM